MDLYSDQALPLTLGIVVDYHAHELAVHVVYENVFSALDVNDVAAIGDY